MMTVLRMNPSSPSQCPLCGKDNQCGAVRGVEACWCRATKIAPEALAALAPAQRGVACLCPSCARGEVPSPCIGVCAVGGDGCCKGCGRTLAEIAAWPYASAEQRRAVLQRLARRRG